MWSALYRPSKKGLAARLASGMPTGCIFFWQPTTQGIMAHKLPPLGYGCPNLPLIGQVWHLSFPGAFH